MSDLQKYIAKRKVRDSDFAKNYDKGYKDFKIGVMLKIAREESGFTQEQLAGYSACFFHPPRIWIPYSSR